MAEQSSVPVNSLESNQSNAIGYGFMRPSFSYLSASRLPSGSSQQSSSAPVMQAGSFGSARPVASGLTPSFSYNVSHSSSGFPAAQTSSAVMNVRAVVNQQMGSIGTTPTLTQSVPQPVHTNSSPSAAAFASNSVNNPNTWMPPTPFQVPTGIPRTPVTPGPPGIPSPMPSHSNATIQYQTVTSYPSPYPHAAPGAWLQHQPITGFSRAPLSPYSGIVPGPYPVPHRGVPPQLVSMTDIQPPGVLPTLSSVGAPLSSVSGSQSIVSSVHVDFPPGVDNGKHVNNSETNHETSKREQVQSWTAHRTEAGIVYYYNAITGESTYEKPSGFEGESDKAAIKPSPISWQKLAGADWTEVTTNDGKIYYYNSTTQSSSWQIPAEVTELRKKQEADALKAQSVSNTNMAADIGPVPATSISTPAATTGGRDATPLRPAIDVGSSSALDLIKKKLQDSGIPATSTGPSFGGVPDIDINGSKPIEVGTQTESTKIKGPNVDDEMSDSSSDSEDDDRGPTKDKSIFQFKEMLKERGVAPFSKWEKELPKIVFDPRFKAIASHSARRALFDHYVRTRAEEERKEKRAAQKAALEGFKQLLEEAKEEIDHNTDYQSFKKRWREDLRFQALDRKERESLLNERVFPLKRAAQEKAQAERAAAVSSFKSLLQDKGDVTSISRWSKVKESLKGDPRYKSVKHEDREKLFNEYVAELKAAEEMVEQKSKAKQDEEEKLKERERALRKRKEREEQEVERVRVKARRKEAIESYQALLVETIKDAQASWTESKPKLDKDPQGRAAYPNLDKFDLEKLFREHIKSLHERCVGEFRSLLTEVIIMEAASQEKDGKTVINSWSTAKHILKSDPRYNKMPRKDRESVWRRHAEDIQRKLKLAEEADKHVEGKSSSTDPGKPVSISRRTHDRRMVDARLGSLYAKLEAGGLVTDEK